MSHHNYYLDLCVDTYVVNGDAVLLRFHDKYKYWGAPGGHIDPGEDANEAALREVLEEAGLKVELVGPEGWKKTDVEGNRDLVPPLFLNRHPINDVHDHSAFIFIARSDSREVDPHEEESDEAKFLWCTKEELDKMLSEKKLLPDVHRYASAALHRLAK